MLSDRCLTVCPVLSALSALSVTLVYCGPTVGRTKTKLGTQVDLGRGHIVLNGHQVPIPHSDTAPIFGHVYCGQTAAWIKMRLGMEVGLGPGHTVLDADPAPLRRKGGTAPKFSAQSILPKPLHGSTCHFVWTWLDPSDIVLDGDPAPLPKMPPIFGLCLLWPNGCMDQDATWYDGRPRPGQHCVRCGPSFTPPPPPPRGTALHNKSAHVCCGQTAG